MSEDETVARRRLNAYIREFADRHPAEFEGYWYPDPLHAAIGVLGDPTRFAAETPSGVSIVQVPCSASDLRELQSEIFEALEGNTDVSFFEDDVLLETGVVRVEVATSDLDSVRLALAPWTGRFELVHLGENEPVPVTVPFDSWIASDDGRVVSVFWEPRRGRAELSVSESESSVTLTLVEVRERFGVASAAWTRGTESAHLHDPVGERQVIDSFSGVTKSRRVPD